MLKSITRKLFGGGARSGETRLQQARMIACDLDGTLLNRDEMIGAASMRMIREIESIGVPFVIITRRHHQAVEPHVELLGTATPIVSLDGAMIRLPYADTPSFTAEFDQDFARDILDEIDQMVGVSFCAITPDHFFHSDPDPQLPWQHQHWNVDLQQVNGIDPVKGTVLEIIATGSLHGVNAVLEYVERKMQKNELKLHLFESRSMQGTWYLEVRPIQATKEMALERLTAEWGIPLKEVIGIGDYHNDLGFCGKSGYVVALANAVKEMKQIADFVTERSCLDEGINEFFELFLRLRGADVDAMLKASTPEQVQRRRSR